MTTDCLNIYYQNVRGLNTVSAEVRQQISNNNYDVYIFTETWLNGGCFDCEFFESGYNVYRRDRETTASTKSRGGGVLIAVSDRLVSTRVDENEGDCEDVWVKVTAGSGRRPSTLNICAIYLPPPVRNDDVKTFTDKVNSILQNSSDRENTLIVGDFNMGGIAWQRDGDNDTCGMTPVGYGNCELFCRLVDFLMLNDLGQYNNVKNKNNKVLDLILCNKESIIHVTECHNPIKDIDRHHPALEIQLKMSVESLKKTVKIERKNFYKGDYSAINDYLKSVDWGKELERFDNVNEMVSRFYEILHETITKHIPMSKNRPKSYPVWYSPQLIKLLKKKLKYHRRFKKYGNPLDKLEFDYLRADSGRMIKECYKKYIGTIEYDLKKNPKFFWTHIKNLRKCCSSYPSTMILNNTISSDTHKIPDMFATHFSSVYEAGDSDLDDYVTNRPSDLNSNIQDVLNPPQFSPEDVNKKLKKIDTAKGVGPDNVHPLYLVRCADELTLPLCMLFNRSMQTGMFPDTWKMARVVPIYKNGKKDHISNYRPIAIISAIAKIFESMVHAIIYAHIQKHIINEQHGFMKMRSTCTNLVLFASDLVETVDRGSQVDAVYTDFSKAFDKVNHKILLDKLYLFGITDNILDWCRSYLTKRPMEVVVENEKSKPFLAHSGVPQGSVLGPLFFNIFINDLSENIKYSRLYLFADDLKLTKEITCMEDSRLLQDDIDNLQHWCTSNKMLLNASKCHHIKFTRKHNKFRTDYIINGTRLAEVDTIRDLGITVDGQLCFSNHIDRIIKEANKSLGFILRNTKDFKKPSSLILLYNSYVRSKLEYCSTVWSPDYTIHKNRIERVQKKFIRSLSYRFQTPKTVKTYAEKLKHFHLDTLSGRRLCLDMSFLHKVVNDKIDSPTLVGQFVYHVPTRIPRYPCRLFKPKFCRTRLGRNSPVVRLARLYNDLTNKLPELDIHFQRLPKFLRIIRKSDVL